MLNNNIELLSGGVEEVNKSVKLKDLIYKYLDESYEDLKDCIDNPEFTKVITKYNNILINIKNVCLYRNKF